MSGRPKVLVPVNGAYEGALRVHRASGKLDTEGIERVLSPPSAQALSLARQLEEMDIVAVHVDRGAGEEVLREALAYGIASGILIEGTEGYEGDAAARATLIANVVREHGPFAAIVGPAWSEFGGFTGTLAALAGELDLPVVVGVRALRSRPGGFAIEYQSIFGSYALDIPQPAVIIAGEPPVRYPTAWGVHDSATRGIQRVKASAEDLRRGKTRRLRIEPIPEETRSAETLDGATLVRRMRSRALIPEATGGGA